MNRPSARADVLLKQAHQAAVGLLNRRFSGFGLTASQYYVLTALAAGGGLSQAAIGRAIGSDRATAGAMIRRLADHGLVERAGGNVGRNGHVIVLTADGAELLRRTEGDLEKAMEQLLSPLDSNERRTLVDLLARLGHLPGAGVPARNAGKGDGTGRDLEQGRPAAQPARAPRADRTGMPLEQRVTFRFSRLAALSTRPVARLFRVRFGLTVSSWRTLITIGSLQPTSPTEVAKRMSIKADKVTRAVDHLVEKGLVRRRSDTSDGRRSVIALTAQGRKVYTQIDGIRCSIEQELLSVLGERELGAFQEYMGRLDDHGRRIFQDDRYWTALLSSAMPGRPTSALRPATRGERSPRTRAAGAR